MTKPSLAEDTDFFALQLDPGDEVITDQNDPLQVLIAQEENMQKSARRSMSSNRLKAACLKLGVKFTD